MTITHTDEYAYQEITSVDTGGRIYDVADPPPTYAVSMNWRVEDGHCFHMRFEPEMHRWVPFDEGGGYMTEYDARFIDKCCHTDCSERIIR